MPAEFKDDLQSLEAGLDALQLGNRHIVKDALWKRVLPPVIAIGIVWAVWQWAFTRHFQPEWVLPSPKMVFDAVKTQWDAGFVKPSVFNSLKRAVIGFTLSMLIATPLGILVARVKPIRAVLGPVLSGLQQLPSVAWVPAAVIWFGLTPKTI